MALRRSQGHAAQNGGALAVLQSAQNGERDGRNEAEAEARGHHVFADTGDPVDRVIIRVTLGKLRVQRFEQAMRLPRL